MRGDYNILNEKGTALMIALIMLLLLTLIGFAGITTSNIEVQISGNQRLTNTAIYAAEAGIERIRSEMDNSLPPYNPLFNLAYVYDPTAVDVPHYRIYAGIESWPNAGTENAGNNWNDYNGSKVLIPGRSIDGSRMYVFLVEGYSGLAAKRMEVGIVTPEESAGGPPAPSGTGYSGGTS